MNGGRTEKRSALRVAVQLAREHQLALGEMAFTENISPRGARVLASRSWKPNEQVVISALCNGFRSIARVVYCERLGRGRLAIGLKFPQPCGRLLINPFTTSEFSSRT
jgi:hypothetical protein